jgi:basic membrane protein A
VPRRRILILVILGAVALLLALPRGRRDAGAKPTSGFRVGLVFDIGGRGDKSFNDAAYLGLARAERELAVAVEYVEPGGPEDREAALRLFAARKFDLVIGVGFIFSRDVDTVARDYPGVRFACVDYAPEFGPNGPKPMPSNVTGLAFRENEGAFLVGAAAGLLTRSRHVGFVGGMDIPLIHKFEAGYRAGVAAVCPSCMLHVAYAGSTPDAFRDPAKGKSIALAQIGLGADVLFHAAGSTGHGVFEAAKDASVLAIGVDADQADEAPGTVVTSMIKRGDVAVFDAIVAAKEQHLRGGMLVLGLAEGGLDWVHDGPHAGGISEDVRSRVELLRAAVVKREISVPDE